MNPFLATFSFIDNKWKIHILGELFTKGERRFYELFAAVACIGKTMLSQELRSLCHDGLVSRRKFDGRKVAYSLTPFGQSLKPVIEAMRAWGEEYLSNCNPLPQDDKKAGN